MCGLVGIIAKNPAGFVGKDAEMFEQLLYTNAVRGWDATGVFGVTKQGNVDIKKQAVTAADFISTTQFQTFKQNIIQKYHFVLGHNRKATHGDKRDQDSHPFWDKNNKICLIHNGMISNHKSFCKDSTVDSAAIANALAKAENIEDVIEKIEGAYAFIWYDVEKKRLNFIRNSTRPLFISETQSSFIISSEESLAYWIAKRNNTEIITSGIFEENIPYYIDMDDKILYKESEAIEQKKSGPQHHPITVTSNITTHILNSKKTTYEVTECPENFFLSDSNFNSIKDVTDVIELNTKLLCVVSSYEEVANGSNYKIEFDIVNVDKPFIECVHYCQPHLFNAMNLTGIYEVVVRGLTKYQDKIRIFVSNLEEIKSWQITSNNLIVTEEMYFDDRFPIECDVCNIAVKWKELTNSNVCIENHAVASTICPKCSGVTNV